MKKYLLISGFAVTLLGLTSYGLFSSQVKTETAMQQSSSQSASNTAAVKQPVAAPSVQAIDSLVSELDTSDLDALDTELDAQFDF